MKNLLTRRIAKRYGFTLVELLVVIGIIAILAAVSMNVGIVVLNQAKKAKAQNTATQIQTAVLSYYTEYSVYPTPSGSTAGTDYKIDDTDTVTGASAPASAWGGLVQCLSGGVSPSNYATLYGNFNNSRAIAFLNMKATDVVNTGSSHRDAPVNPITPPSASNGPYYNIAIDADYSGVIGGANETTSNTWLPNFNVTPFNATTGGGTSTAGVAVWANCSPSSSITTGTWWVHTY